MYRTGGDRRIVGALMDAVKNGKQVTVVVTGADGKQTTFTARVRIDTPKERDYFQHGGILHYVLRQLAGTGAAA